MEPYREQKLLKGLRHIVQAESSGFMDDPAFNAGVSALRPSGLVYEILIYPPPMVRCLPAPRLSRLPVQSNLPCAKGWRHD